MIQIWSVRALHPAGDHDEGKDGCVIQSEPVTGNLRASAGTVEREAHLSTLVLLGLLIEYSDTHVVYSVSRAGNVSDSAFS